MKPEFTVVKHCHPSAVNNKMSVTNKLGFI